MKKIIVNGDASDISTWDDQDERSGPPAALHNELWYEWYQALLAKRELHWMVGGTKLVRAHRLMLVPPIWPDRTNRSAALGWPITEHRVPVNLVRRFLDDKKPRYKGLVGREHHLWPDRTKMSRDVVLVCGMRDACWARAAGLDAYTTTGGVDNWRNIERLAYERRFVVCFDQGEQPYAKRLAQRLREHRALEATVLAPPVGFKDIAELAEARGRGAVRRHLGRR